MAKWQDVVYDLILDTIRMNEGKASWQEISAAVKGNKQAFAAVERNSWLVIRGVLQYMMDSGEIFRIDDVHVEEYMITEGDFN